MDYSPVFLPEIGPIFFLHAMGLKLAPATPFEKGYSPCFFPKSANFV